MTEHGCLLFPPGVDKLLPNPWSMEPVILRGGCHRPGHASSTMTKAHLPGEDGRVGGPAKLGFAAGHLVKGKTLSPPLLIFDNPAHLQRRE